ncbi:MAG TPA: hypothetical protein DD670_11345, partial [Planctomycetaceae bacterium]|nr:hypothetical protein [Planctomycetaceae bacterium]
MRCHWLLFLLAAGVIAATGATTAQALTWADVYAYYPFDNTTGMVFSDAGPSNADATFHRPLRIEELPAIDVANVTTTGKIGNGLSIGNRPVPAEGGTNHNVLVDIPVTADLPASGDSFAVSYWLNVTSWTSCYGMIAAYNGNGLNWNLGMHNATSARGLLAWTSDADVGAGGNAQWTANLSTAGLEVGTYNHFVVQFEGSLGVTACYVNGVSVVDAVDENLFWGNRKEGFVLGGRALDARNFTVPNSTPFLDDLAIIDGVVDSADV